MPLKDVQQSLQLELQEGEQGKTIVVKSVAAGSKAQQNGIAAGQQLLALSQTQSQQFWTLDPNGIEEHKWIRAGSFVWDTLDVSGNEDLELVLSQPAGAKSLLDEVESQQDTPLQQPTIGGNLSSKYNEQYPDNPMVSALERRVKRRKERQEVEQKRNDVPFFLFMLGVFVVPPLVIILIAYSTGYLDSLSGHYTDTH